MSEELRELKDLVPSVYNEVPEMDAIVAVEQGMWEDAHTRSDFGLFATFIQTATLENGGIQRFEELLGIVAQNDETEEFRRNRIMERWNWKPPYSIRYLKSQLDTLIGFGYLRNNEEEVVGEGAYEIYVDYANYTIFIFTTQKDQPWAQEVSFFINSVKPCNIIFAFKSEAQSAEILINEEIYTYGGEWNYRLSLITTAKPWLLGEKAFVTGNLDFHNWNYKMEGFRLGQTPFSSLLEGDIVKMASDGSIKQELINREVTYITTQIHHVIINEGLSDEFTISSSDFLINTRVAQDAVLIYYVGTEQTTEIKTISIYSSDNMLLSKSIVSVPVLAAIQVKHKIHMKEGE